MKVVILCGGLGTRLKEETGLKPKPMVNIGSYPILWHIMKYYSMFGFKEFILCLGYKGEMIKEYFYHYDFMNNDVTIKLGQPNQISYLKHHNENDWAITMINTGQNTTKGERLKKIEKYLDNEDIFMMTYGDGLGDIDLKALLKFHKEHGKIATVTGVVPTSRFGELKINQNKVESFNEKPQNATSIINGGYFVFNKAIFDYLNNDLELETVTLEILAKQGELMVYKHNSLWSCMDNLKDMNYLNNLWDENKAFWKIW